MTVSTRIAIMDRGRTVQVGTPGEIYEYPNSLYVAEFLGEVNVFEGRVVEAGKDHVRVHSEDGGCDIFADRGIDAVAGQEVYAAIRPEKIEIAKAPPPDDRGQLHHRAGLRHRLSGQPLRLPRPPGQRTHRQGHRRQPLAPGRAPDHLGGSGVAVLAAVGQRDSAVVSRPPGPRPASAYGSAGPQTSALEMLERTLPPLSPWRLLAILGALAGALRPPAGGRRAADLAAAVLPGAVPDRPQAQLLGIDAGAAALCAAARTGRRGGRLCAQNPVEPLELRHCCCRRHLYPRLPQLAADRRSSRPC